MKSCVNVQNNQGKLVKQNMIVLLVIILFLGFGDGTQHLLNLSFNHPPFQNCITSKYSLFFPFAPGSPEHIGTEGKGVTLLQVVVKPQRDNKPALEWQPWGQTWRITSVSNPHFLRSSVFCFKRFFFGSSTHYVAHDPISINGTADFLNQAANEGWNGTGTSIDPIIIAGYNITNASSNLITIRNTDLYFQICDNLFNGIKSMFDGLVLTNVTHGTVDNNVFDNTYDGIILQTASQNVIRNNIIQCRGYGIHVSSSGQTSLTDNSINSRSGIRLKTSINTTLMNNMITPRNLGIYVRECAQTTISHTLLITGQDQGFFLYNTSLNVITDNHIANSAQGAIILKFSVQNLLTHNILTNNSGDGIEAQTVENTLVTNNTISGNGGNGISIEQATNTTLTYNTLERNAVQGIALKNSAPNTIFSNSIKENIGRGILLSDSGVSMVSFNELGQNGIEITLSNENMIVSNNITYGGDNIAIAASVNNTIAFNTVSYGRDGIKLTAAANENTITNNTIVSVTRYGVQVSDSTQTTITANVFSSCNLEAITLDVTSTVNLVSWNEFWGNNLDSTSQASDDGAGNIFMYNFWDDWASPDANFDGIVDQPYAIDGNAGNSDPYPQVDPNMPATSLTPLEPASSTTPISFTGVLVIFGALITVVLLTRQRKKITRI